MLENSVWKQYNETNNFKEKLVQFCSLNLDDIILDEKSLYGVMKAKLTKKELKLFAMDSANLESKNIKDEFAWSDDEFKQAKLKLYKKLKQDKVRLSFRVSSLVE